MRKINLTLAIATLVLIAINVATISSQEPPDPPGPGPACVQRIDVISSIPNPELPMCFDKKEEFWCEEYDGQNGDPVGMCIEGTRNSLTCNDIIIWVGWEGEEGTPVLILCTDDEQ